MKFSLSWLKDHLETDATATQIAAKLTAIGLELEGMTNPAEGLAGFRVARVLTAEKHPDADKLQVLRVDAGPDANGGDPLTVVCGAPNARAGMTGVLGLPGAVVPATGMEMRKTAIRGVESSGMMCSSRELDLGDDHDGIVELPDDVPVGMAYADYALLDDPVFDVSITPNRPDCMGVHGIARDLAAAGLGRLKPIAPPVIAPTHPPATGIRIEAAEGCSAVLGRTIRGVCNGSSPGWMQARLISAGQRPISALVDITNYVMLTYGRPSHVYDLATLSGELVVRPARQGETVLALNDREYVLEDGMLVIADDHGVHDIAGIMGGARSGCTEATSDVFLEVALFDPVRVAQTGRALNLVSDARSRFERGLDPLFLPIALDILTGMIVQICGGEASEAIFVGQTPEEGRTISFDPGLVVSLGGLAIPVDEQEAILDRLEFVVTRSGARWTVGVPGWRPDIDGAPDLVEEIIRIAGLDRIPSVPLPRLEGVARPTATPLQRQERKVRRAAAARGNCEAVTWSFLPPALAQAFATQPLWVLANPISEDMKAMRPSLLPGLLAAAQRNLARGARSVRLFEIGRRYLRADDGTSAERLTLGLVLAGDRTLRNWQTGKAVMFDAFDAKAEALALLDAAGAPTANLQVMEEAGEQFHPGRSATLRLGPKNVLARFGAIHPRTAQQFDLAGPVMAVELFIDAIPAAKAGKGFARAAFAPPALQAVLRDFAFLVSEDTAAGDLVRAVRAADKQHIVEARVFDQFSGAGVPDGQKSLAVEVTLQPQGASFTDNDLTAISDSIVAAASKLGAVLRG
ncbi:phenylalanine--tRNA ligase subunit beta [Croceicoccus sp. F390]|uniref:Phenylalanine--tRNA ligase beta subunit n=1 Tax=Croceicoccus esteveae TaxID=3075597 RepID=A0ABU2ZJH4_9SPHN|nr:phenylalanine--tRNA ligase subunit beta [Croceicoccus sp. F390]MDT0576757.1 phenylalanine--tRNA ligase subunit beta [Croceicoccus sp. F390]